jgi:hypothetical protein
MTERGTYNGASKGGPDITSSDTDRADGQQTELSFQLLLVARGVDYLAHVDSIIGGLKTRLLILIETHFRQRHCL